MDEMLKDSRFTHVVKDPKYRHIPKAEKKVKIDHRFKDMFENKNFYLKYTIDKRGRPFNQTTTEDLQKYYDLSSNEDENESVSSVNQKDEEKKKKKTKNIKNKQEKQSKQKQVNKKKIIKKIESSPVKDLSNEKSNDDESDESSNNEFDESLSNKDIQEEISELDFKEIDKQLHKKEKNNEFTSKVKEKLKDFSINYARGEGILLTDSSSEEESSEASDSEAEDIEHNWGEFDKEAETTDKITCRLAICNMDWDRIRAVDLMILLNSFLPSDGNIRSVVIYPSEFGQQRMKEEEINGPIDLENKNIENKENKDNEDEIEDDNEEGAKYHVEKLRQYQLNRLKYYYAVAEFDSAETANKVYTECDGIEYESTATKLDLRFIPDDMTFDQEPKETCTEMPELTKYQPRQFTTTALQQAKVQLTWDETSLERQEFTHKLNSGKLQDIDENDLQTYLASGSEDNSDIEEKKGISLSDEVNKTNSVSETNNDPIGKYRCLLKTIEEEEEAKKNKGVELEFTWSLGAKENSLEESMKNKEKLTPFEQYLEKRKAKKKTKKEEKQKLKDQNQRSDSEDSLPSDVDMNDKYFAEEFKNGKSTHKKEKKNKADNINSSNEREEAELELLLLDQEDNKNHFNMKHIEENANMSKSKKKRLSKKKTAQAEMKEDDFEIDIKDQRFAALFTSDNFNIDPTNSNYKNTKATETLIKEKLKRIADNETFMKDPNQFKKAKIDKTLSTELQVLVKSVTQKAQNIAKPIKR